jgi:alanine racemase
MGRVSTSEAVIDLAAIRANVAALAAHTHATVMAVVKADGYGHGMVPSARAALAGGATWLGVAQLDEALAVRAAGIHAPTLAWLWAPDEADLLVQALDANVTVGVSSQWALDLVRTWGERKDRAASVHMKIDTGLSRNGAYVDDWPGLTAAAAKAESGGHVRVEGVWSHFASADDPQDPSVDSQIRAFEAAVDVARQAGLTPTLRHLANSAAMLTRPDAHYDLVRLGIAIYGLDPVPGDATVRLTPATTPRLTPATTPRLTPATTLRLTPATTLRLTPATTLRLTPAMTLRSHVVLGKRVRAGEGVSYGHRYTTTDDTSLALIPLGYGDGIPRGATNVAPVLVDGHRATISGRVCMDQFVVDLHGRPVEAGADVILFGPGTNGEPTAQDWADAVDTIHYEIVTRIGARVPRRYVGEAPIDEGRAP